MHYMKKFYGKNNPSDVKKKNLSWAILVAYVIDFFISSKDSLASRQNSGKISTKYYNFEGFLCVKRNCIVTKFPLKRV